MRKILVALLMLGMLILPIISGVCVIPIEHKMIIDNINDFSDYIFIAHLWDGNSWSPQHYYFIFDSKEIPNKKDGKTFILKEVYAIEKDKFKDVNRTRVAIPTDTCGNIVINNTQNNSCNASSYTIYGGASYSYKYNFEIDREFIALGISEEDIGTKECSDMKMPDIRKDYFRLSLTNGKLKTNFDKGVYYYLNKLKKEAYPDEQGNIEIIKLTDEEAKFRISFFQRIWNWIKNLFN